MINVNLLRDAEPPEGTHFGVRLVFDRTVHSPPGKARSYSMNHNSSAFAYLVRETASKLSPGSLFKVLET